MAGSSNNGVLGFDVGDFPIRTCGPAGYNDNGDPFAPVWAAGDSPGSLALNDHAAPHMIKKKAQKKAAKADPVKKAFDGAVNLGWLPYFEEAVNQYGDDSSGAAFTVADLLAIGYRESIGLNPKYLKVAGDSGHGYGLMQVDIRSYKDWVDAGNWKDARLCILKGAEVLRLQITSIENGQGKQLSVYSSKSKKSYSFEGKSIEGATLLRVGIAAYNAGLWPYYCYSTGEDIDRYTYGQNYSADVLANAARFQILYDQYRPGVRINLHSPLGIWDDNQCSFA